MDTLMVVILCAAAFLIGLRVYARRGKQPSQSGWVIGPLIHGVNHSVGMPDRPTMQALGWYFDFPGPSGKVDYVMWQDPPTLAGKKQITIRYHVTGGGFTPFESFGGPATLGLCVQRKGDDWSAKAKYQSYRWYCNAAPVIEVGEHTLTVPLDIAFWADVYGQTYATDAFTATMADLDNISVVFGGGSGRGHGAFATEPSRFTLLEINLE